MSEHWISFFGCRLYKDYFCPAVAYLVRATLIRFWLTRIFISAFGLDFILEMAVFRIWLLLVVTAVVSAHEDNTEKLEDLAYELEKVKSDQMYVDKALEALETNLSEMLAAAMKPKEEKAESKIGAGSKDENLSKFRRYIERLKALEEKVKSIKSFVEAERQLDASLTELTTDTLTDVDEKILETKRITDAVKDGVKISLGPVETILQSVKETADKRNFNLGGAVFYGGHGSACIGGNDECRVPKMHCRAGQCQCLPGLSYDRKTQSCVERCDSYGLDFELVPHRIIRGNNSAVYMDIRHEDCRQFCLNTTEFNCITYEYFDWYNDCYLSEITKLEEEEKWEYNSAGCHFQRNCN